MILGLQVGVDHKEEIKQEIAYLKQKHNAIILAHSYQRPEIQEIADVLGDSLALARAAQKTDNEVIVFCGVHFMAESASVLNPNKTVLLPARDAGCNLADMATARQVKQLKEQYPQAAVVTYINSSAEVKAQSDVIVTSSNAVKVVSRLKEKDIIFVPDRNLGRHVQNNLPDKNIILWNGFCIVHMRLRVEDVLERKREYPDAKVVVHPECEKEILDLADCIASTAGMFDYVKKSSAEQFIIGTEKGMLYKFQLENPGKEFIFPSKHLCCSNMKQNTLPSVRNALERFQFEVKVPREIAERCLDPLERMLALSV